jgi:hypothetical protein
MEPVVPKPNAATLTAVSELAEAIDLALKAMHTDADRLQLLRRVVYQIVRLGTEDDVQDLLQTALIGSRRGGVSGMNKR